MSKHGQFGFKKHTYKNKKKAKLPFIHKNDDARVYGM